MYHRVFTVVVLSALFRVHDVSAHHSFAAEFDYDLIGSIEGEVVEVLYVNPHARYFLEVDDDAGNKVLWDAQSRSPSALQRVGWTRDSIKAGERIVIEGNLGNDNTRKIWIRKVTLSSGDVIRPVQGEPEEDASR
jgi:hypothetical protein